MPPTEIDKLRAAVNTMSRTLESVGSAIRAMTEAESLAAQRIERLERGFVALSIMVTYRDQCSPSEYLNAVNACVCQIRDDLIEAARKRESDHG